MIEVIEVKTKKQIREFINFPLNLYKNIKYSLRERPVKIREEH